MSGSISRLQAISAVTNYKPISEPLNFAETPAKELFGVNVFSPAVMETRLPKAVYKSLKKTIDTSQPLDSSVADVVAFNFASWSCGRAVRLSSAKAPTAVQIRTGPQKILLCIAKRDFLFQNIQAASLKLFRNKKDHLFRKEDEGIMLVK